MWKKKSCTYRWRSSKINMFSNTLTLKRWKTRHCFSWTMPVVNSFLLSLMRTAIIRGNCFVQLQGCWSRPRLYHYLNVMMTKCWPIILGNYFISNIARIHTTLDSFLMLKYLYRLMKWPIVKDVIIEAPSKSRSVDPVPTDLLHRFIQTFLYPFSQELLTCSSRVDGFLVAGKPL